MKIYRNNIHIDLDLDEFLTILETQTFEDLLLLIMELDNKAATQPPAPPAPKISFLDTTKLDEKEMLLRDINELEQELDGVEYVDDMEEIMNIFADILSGGGDIEIEYYEVDGEGLDELGIAYSYSIDGSGHLFYDPIEDYSLSTEDKKVRRILNRYRDLVE